MESENIRVFRTVHYISLSYHQWKVYARQAHFLFNKMNKKLFNYYSKLGEENGISFLTIKKSLLQEGFFMVYTIPKNALIFVKALRQCVQSL